MMTQREHKIESHEAVLVKIKKWVSSYIDKDDGSNGTVPSVVQDSHDPNHIIAPVTKIDSVQLESWHHLRRHAR